MACNFTEADVQAECVRREQELEDAGLLALDGGKYISAREAERERLEDYEFCRDLVSEFARESARRTGEAIGDIRDRYERIVAEFLAARYVAPDGKHYSLRTVLRDRYESDSALKEFLPKFLGWMGDCVSACIREHRFEFSPLYQQTVPRRLDLVWSQC